MKKLTTILLTVILTLSLFACGEKPPTESTPFCTSTPEPTTSPELTTSPEPTTPPMQTEQTTPAPIHPAPANVPQTLSDADFFPAPPLDFSSLTRTYHGISIMGHDTWGNQSTRNALRILSYEELKTFVESSASYGGSILQHYEESFFEENALLFIPFGKSSSTSYHVQRISCDYGNYMIELNFYQPYVVTADFTYEMLLIPDTKHNIENAKVTLLTHFQIQTKEENQNHTFHPTMTDIGPEQMQNAFSRVTYANHETLLQGYDAKEIPTNFTSNIAFHLRFEDYESFLTWQTNALKPLEESGNYGSNYTALATAAQYDEAYFEENTLNIVIFNRPSGSYTHKDATAYLCANGKIIVRLTTDTPDIWTCDMATWLLFLPQKGEIESMEFCGIFADFE